MDIFNKRDIIVEGLFSKKERYSDEVFDNMLILYKTLGIKIPKKPSKISDFVYGFDPDDQKYHPNDIIIDIKDIDKYINKFEKTKSNVIKQLKVLFPGSELELKNISETAEYKDAIKCFYKIELMNFDKNCDIIREVASNKGYIIKNHVRFEDSEVIRFMHNEFFSKLKDFKCNDKREPLYVNKDKIMLWSSTGDGLTISMNLVMPI